MFCWVPRTVFQHEAVSFLGTRQMLMHEKTCVIPILLHCCFTVTQDDSSDEEVNKYFEPEIVSSDGEADLQLERRLSGKHRPEKVPGSSNHSF